MCLFVQYSVHLKVFHFKVKLCLCDKAVHRQGYITTFSSSSSVFSYGRLTVPFTYGAVDARTICSNFNIPPSILLLALFAWVMSYNVRYSLSLFDCCYSDAVWKQHIQPGSTKWKLLGDACVKSITTSRFIVDSSLTCSNKSSRLSNSRPMSCIFSCRWYGWQKSGTVPLDG